MHVARRLHQRLAGDFRGSVDDLAAVGAIGLLEAFDRFEPARGIAFSTFAEYRVRGAMYDSLRHDDAFTRRRRQLARSIQAARDEVRRTEGRAPEAQDVARRLGLDVQAFHEACQTTAPVVHVHLDDATGVPVGERVADPGTGPLDRIVAHEVAEALEDAIGQLPERQRECVRMYYTAELPLADIAKVLGVTVSRISQILTEAREKLRRRLETTLDPEDLEAPAPG
jgi:RNA polymerase sigma factor for flagellar operon FliA